jgi:hypothetical protein
MRLGLGSQSLIRWREGSGREFSRGSDGLCVHESVICRAYISRIESLMATRSEKRKQGMIEPPPMQRFRPCASRIVMLTAWVCQL